MTAQDADQLPMGELLTFSDDAIDRAAAFVRASEVERV